VKARASRDHPPHRRHPPALPVGFAVADGRPKVIAVESSVTFAFVIVAAAAVTGSPWLLVAGMAAHGLKDLWQHRTHFVADTRWWPPFCMVVDWSWPRSSPARSPPACTSASDSPTANASSEEPTQAAVTRHAAKRWLTATPAISRRSRAQGADHTGSSARAGRPALHAKRWFQTRSGGGGGG
jgi:hypothetical protein